MAKKHHPRRGSMQFWPRKRSRRSFARVRTWHDGKDVNLGAFIGYKAGMTHIIAKDKSPNTMFKKENIAVPVTIIECPPLKSLSLRFYQNSYDGLVLVSEVFSKTLDKEVKKHIKLTKKEGKIPESFDDIRLRVYTQPKLTGIGKKKPETLEVGISGKDNKERLEFGKNLLGKEIKLSDVLKETKLLDIHSITKGKGFQGSVKRFGVKIRSHKAEKTKRGAANLGAWTPKKVQFTVPQSGRMGHHQRIEYNKLSVLIDSDPKKVNPKGGFLRYGLVKNDYIMLKGSVPGPVKRTIIMTPGIRKGSTENLEIINISLESKQ